MSVLFVFVFGLCADSCRFDVVLFEKQRNGRQFAFVCSFCHLRRSLRAVVRGGDSNCRNKKRSKGRFRAFFGNHSRFRCNLRLFARHFHLVDSRIRGRQSGAKTQREISIISSHFRSKLCANQLTTKQTNCIIERL